MSDSDFFSPSPDDALLRRADELLNRLFDRTLDDAEADELRILWNRLPQAESEAKDRLKIERLFQLSRDFKSTLSPEKRQELDAACRARLGLPARETSTLYTGSFSADVETFSSSARAKMLIRARKEGLKSYHVVLFAIVLCVFILGVYSEFFFDSSPKTNVAGFRPIARVEAVLDVRWTDEDALFKEGQELGTEAVRFDDGIVQLVFPNGIRIAVKGPADFRLNTRKKMFLGQGRLCATVPPEGKGFEVATPFFSAVDLGTEFLLDVRRDNIEAHTIRGKIELSGVEEKKIELNGGEALRLDTAGKLARFNAEPNRFLTDLFVLGLREMRDERQLDQWNRQRQRILQMPDLRLFYDFEDDGDFVVNHAQPSESGRILGAGRCKGRWSRKKACSFQRKNDAVDMSLSRNMTSATLWTSFRLDSFSQFNHVLLGSRGTDAGNFVWQIFSDGSVQLAVRPENDARPVLNRTASVFRTNHCGAWYQLATVLDASKREIRTYLDGKLLDVSPTVTSVPLRLGEATLGNWLPTEKTATASCLNGRIDQLVIFDRALTDEEVRQLSFTYSPAKKETEP